MLPALAAAPLRDNDFYARLEPPQPSNTITSCRSSMSVKSAACRSLSCRCSGASPSASASHGTRSCPQLKWSASARKSPRGSGLAHDQGLIHRDIKPGNLFLEGEQGRVRILDFGLARALTEDTKLTHPGAFIGTPGYMAPEQSGSGSADARCDLFSLGCVLYRLCTGRPAFSGADVISTVMATCTEKPRSPLDFNPELPDALSDLVMRLLAKDQAKRPAAAALVAAELSAIQEKLIKLSPPQYRTAKPGIVKRATRGRRRALVALLALIAVLLADGTILYMRTPESCCCPGDSSGERRRRNRGLGACRSGERQMGDRGKAGCGSGRQAGSQPI